MPNIKVYDMKGAEVGEMTLADSVFAVEYNESLIHQAVVTYLANQRQGTKGTLTRSEVFAPKSRDYSKKMNVSARRGALLSAISKKVADGEMVVVDELKVSAPKTKEMVAFQKALKLDKKTLVVMDSRNDDVVLAARNIGEITTVPVEQLNTYDVVANAVVVIEKGAVEKIQEVYA